MLCNCAVHFGFPNCTLFIWTVFGWNQKVAAFKPWQMPMFKPTWSRLVCPAVTVDGILYSVYKATKKLTSGSFPCQNGTAELRTGSASPSLGSCDLAPHRSSSSSRSRLAERLTVWSNSVAKQKRHKSLKIIARFHSFDSVYKHEGYFKPNF